MADYKAGFDSRIEESLNFLYNNSIPMFLNGINDPIRYHNSQVRVWGGETKFLIWSSTFLDEEEINRLLLDEFDVS